MFFMVYLPILSIFFHDSFERKNGKFSGKSQRGQEKVLKNVFFGHGAIPVRRCYILRENYRKLCPRFMLLNMFKLFGIFKIHRPGPHQLAGPPLIYESVGWPTYIQINFKVYLQNSVWFCIYFENESQRTLWSIVRNVHKEKLAQMQFWARIFL